MVNRWPTVLKKTGKVFKWVGVALIGIVGLFFVVVFFARAINTNKTKITTNNGIQESLYVTIGGQEQFIQIRGQDVNNPVILFLHGGPGGPHPYASYYYQTELETDYTIVNWDQRGSGRTYYANPDVETDLSVELLLGDLNELVDYLTSRFAHEKVIIMGHSWGTVLGSLYVKDHSQKVSAYIGVSQTVDMLAGENLAVKRASELAKQDGNVEFIEEISVLFNKFTTTETFEDFDFNSFMNMRGLTSRYLSRDNLASVFYSIWLGVASPDMTTRDMKWFIKQIVNLEEFLELEKPLLAYSFFGFNLYEHGMDYEVPVYFISGDCDWITPYPLVEEYYESITAPDKQMILIENTGHSPFTDNREAFSAAVKSLLGKNKI